jgi:RimJ/RimL family protein N-acetyltransferase
LTDRLAGRLAGFTPRQRPQRVVLSGRYARLEPIDDRRHGDCLYAASTVPEAGERFRWLFDYPPGDRSAMRDWIAHAAAAGDPLTFAVIDMATGRAEGRQALMRITPEHGVIEIGGIYWGPAIARSRVATEAQFLFAQYAFDTLGYRRYEWKCNDLNEPSRRAALRFGFRFEGVFRQHMVIKGENRDTAWFAILDHEWPALKAGYQRWLDPSNFDPSGVQRRTLADCFSPTGC